MKQSDCPRGGRRATIAVSVSEIGNKEQMKGIDMKKLMMLAVASVAAVTVFGKSFTLDLRTSTTGKQGHARLKLTSTAAVNGEHDAVRVTNLDAGAADVGEVAVGDVLTFTLFDDVTLTLTLKEQMQSPLGGDVFLAEVAGYEGIKTAVVLHTADGLTIDVQDFFNDKVYKVISTPAGVKVLEVKPSHEGKCGCDALEPPVSGQQSFVDALSKDSISVVDMKSVPRLLSASSGQSDTCVDILVAYDKNAAAYANSNGGGLTNFAQVAVQKMNTALANTGLDESFRFRLVGVVVNDSVAETTLSDTLNGVTSTVNTYWEVVRNKRDELGADIVCVLIDPGSEGDINNQAGLSWALRTTSIASFAGSAYNVCTIMSVANGHTMTHEVGHNMGCGHSTEQETQPGPQLYNYSAGYYLKTGSGSYCTIMAYGHEGSKGTRIPYFSSPIHYYEGVAVGDDLHNNTRTIANTFYAVAQWREQMIPTTYDIGFEPASGTTFDGTLDVSLIPGKLGIEMHYTLDGSNPTIDSPLYNDGPITISRQTTIKAAMCENGVCFFPYTATYYSQTDFAAALGLPELDWEIDASRTAEWCVQTTNTWDGSAFAITIPENGQFNLCTDINGPAILEYRASVSGWNNVNVEVKCDDTLVSKYVKYSSSWEKFEFAIPAGQHQVVMHFSPTSGRASLSLDDMSLHYVSTPSIKPEASSGSTLATPFVGELCISIDCPDEGAVIYYTLDGNEPNEDSLLYEGPFFIQESTRVKAVAVKSGRGRSKVVEGCYVERSLPKPGEWTQYGDGAVESARDGGGRMIVFLACTEWCGFCKLHYRSSRTELFKDWAAVNGIYLVDVLCDNSSSASESISRHFWPLWMQTVFASDVFGYPSYVFADAADATRALGAMKGIVNTTGKTFTYTPESLMECFASHLGADAPLGAPIASIADAYSRRFPFDVTLSNTNTTGTIYYTIDGTIPTRNNGIVYTDAITIEEPGTILKAVVWPDDENGVSGIPLTIKYESLTDAIGMNNVSWSIVDEGPAWSIVSSDPVSLRGGKNPALTSGTSTSTVKATVSGPGIIRFDPKVLRKAQASQLEFRVNDSTVATYNSSNNARVEYIVEHGGETTFTWVYTCSYLDNSSDSYGAWLNNITWESHLVPGTPTNVTASQGTEVIGTYLRWYYVPNATRYVIYRSESDGFVSAETIGTTQKNFFWDTRAESGKVYNYWVAAGNEYGMSDPIGPSQGWIPAACRVTFNANGGWGSMSRQVFVQGRPQRLSKNTFTNSGMRFVGWATSPEGDVCYQNEAEIAITVDLTLFAKWAKDMVWTIDGGTLSAVDMNGETEAFVPEGVKAIAASLFAGETTLMRVVLPEGLTSIGREAFKGCGNLVSINIPSSVTSIGSGAFDGCSSSLYENQSGIRLIDGWICGFARSLTGEITLNGVKGVVPGCLSSATGLCDLFIDGSLKELSDSAFNGCSALRCVSLPEGLVSLGTVWGDCFYGCTSLEQVHLPSTLNTIYSGAFSYCPIKELVIPDGVRVIPQNMCWGCGELQSVSLPDSVGTIGICAFHECEKLVDVVLPRNLVSLEDGAFHGCISLETIDIPDSVVYMDRAFWGCEKLKNVVLPNALQILDSGTFKGCRSLEEIVIPAGITSIASSLFDGCSALERVEMKGNVTSIGWGAFQNCTNLKRIVLPESVSNVEAKAFANCTGLRFVFAPQGLDFPVDAFEDCSSGLQVIYYSGRMQDLNWVTLAYNGNGGVGEMADDVVLAGLKFNLAKNRIVKDGLYFKGWALERGGAVVFNDEDEIELAEDTILYAVWSREIHTIDTTVLPSAVEMVPYECRLAAAGGIEPYSWTPLVDSYAVSAETNTFAQTGVAKGWSDYWYASWNLRLPFSFKFYGRSFTNVYVNGNGTLSFGGANPNGGSYSEYSFTNAVVIAPLQASFDRNTTNDVFITESEDGVTVRWVRFASKYSSEIWDYVYTRYDFSAKLGRDGSIRFSYGTQFEATGERYADYFIGLSAGDGIRYMNITRNVNATNDILLTPTFEPGAHEMPAGFSLSVDGVLSGTPTEAGEYEVKVGVTDATRNRVDKVFPFTVASNPNERPVINSFTPTSSVSLPTGTGKAFKVVASDPEGGALTYRWELDGVTVNGANSATYLYAPQDGGEGTHTLVCYVSDNLWQDVVCQFWTVRVTRTARVTPATTSSEWENMFWSPPGRILFSPGEYDLSRYSRDGGGVMFEGAAGASTTVVKGIPSSYYGGNDSFVGLTIEDSRLGSSEGTVNLENCIVRNCSLTMDGGTLRNCVVTRSRCSFYGARIEHCTICGNEQVSMYAENMWGSVVAAGVINSIMRENSSITIGSDVGIDCSCVDGDFVNRGSGNVASDPLFVDTEDGDFRLRMGSPCVDAGFVYDDITGTDLVGNARVQGVAPDMGAYEGANAGWVIALRVEGHGEVSRTSSFAADGGSVTVTAVDGARPFVRYETNGVFATNQRVFTWSNILADGVVKAVFADYEWHVDAVYGSDANNGLSLSSAKRTIQSAVNSSLAGEYIYVAPGIYGGVVTSNKAIRIIATGGVGVTVIDGDNVERCVTVAVSENSSAMETNTILRGFTLRNGYVNRAIGGGALGGTFQNCTISNCVVSGSGWLRGGGAGYSVLENCLVTGNVITDSGDGGGLYQCNAYGCTIVGNNAGSSGGGVYGGRIYNTIVWGNTARYDVDVSSIYTSSYYANCCVSNKTQYGISTNPKFRNPAAGDYRLADDSPCVDAGNNAYAVGNFDLDGSPRIFGNRVDIGVYEWHPDVMTLTVVFNLDGKGRRVGGGELTQSVEINAAAIAPEVQANEGWAFLGWDADFSCVESNLTVNALWRQTRLNAPVINAPSTFETDSCTITITADAGASIRYTLDGSAPTAASALYAGPITITATTTIKAIAIKSGFDNSAMSSATVTRLPWTFGEYLNWPEQTFTTGGDAAWTRVKGVSADGYALRSGAITHSQTSRLETVVSGSGKVTFTWKVSCEDYFVYREHKWRLDYLAFCIDGVEQGFINGEMGWTTATFDVTGAGNHTLSWLYIKDSDGVAGQDCAWVDAVTWTPSGPADVVVTIGGKSVTVPQTWFDSHAEALAAHGGDRDSYANSTAANGRMSVAECYVVGLDPEIATNDFTITSFPMKADGTPDLDAILSSIDPPQSKWNVSGARPVLKGAASLDAEFEPVTDQNKSSFRFFRVEVELP